MRSAALLARLSLGLLVAAGSFAACSSDNPNTTATSVGQGGQGGQGTGGAGGTGGEGFSCDASAVGELDGDLVELSYDDGTPFSSVREQDWNIQTGQIYVLNDIPLHEAVRFELEHPARVHGFQIYWAHLPEDPSSLLEAGLYADFGYNGFDFWAPEPLWTGTRCAGEADGWVTYKLDEPLEVAHPGLIYVAHRAEPGEAVFSFDESIADPDTLCQSFDNCQSAFNLPTADTEQFFNGLSFSFQYHFLVRLFVEYTDDVQPADKLFQAVGSDASGAHVSWADYDGDGWDDLLTGGKLWRNQGDGTFADVTEAAGLDGVPFTGGVFGDYDNDGCLDLFAFLENPSAPDTLLHNNCSGGFNVVADSGIVDMQTYEDCGDPSNTAAPTAAAAWVDLNADGFVDLYLANFICWDKETYYVDTAFYNDGDGTFTPLTQTDGLKQTQHPSRGVAPVDFDRDGDMDVFVNAYRLRANWLYRNQGDGTLDEVADEIGLAGTLNGLYYGHTIGAAWGDLDNDGDFDNVSANLAHPRFFDFSDKTQILINDGGIFTDLSGSWASPESAAGLRYQETHSVPLLADFDQNGALDLAITCVYDGRPSDFYWGNGDGTFTLDAYRAGITTEDGWGLAAADFDHDGDLDLFADQLFENTITNAGHWLQVKVVGVTANRAGIGAVVTVQTSAGSQIRQVQGGSGKGGQDSLYLHFGLGEADTVESITVDYPGGLQVSYAGPIGADQRVWLYEDSTTAMPGWSAPQ